MHFCSGRGWRREESESAFTRLLARFHRALRRARKIAVSGWSLINLFLCILGYIGAWLRSQTCCLAFIVVSKIVLIVLLDFDLRFVNVKWKTLRLFRLFFFFFSLSVSIRPKIVRFSRAAKLRELSSADIFFDEHFSSSSFPSAPPSVCAVN